MHLVLLRHGRASGLSNDARLTPEGQHAVRSTAGQLHRLGVRPERIVHSGLIRAQETAAILADVLDGPSPEVDERFQPDRDHRVAAEALSSLKQSTIVVSHQPLLTLLAHLMVSGGSGPEPVRFSTATAGVLEKNDGGWTVSRIVEAE